MKRHFLKLFSTLLTIVIVLTPLFGQSWTEHTIADDFDGAFSVYAADVDGDGDMDVLGAASVSGYIVWWDNNGSQVFTERTINTDFANGKTVYAADIDGDGDMDVLGASQNDDDITWWENDGTPANGGWSEHIIDTDFDGAFGVYAADINGDGDMDVLGAAFTHDDITWWENDGSESFTKRTIDTDFDGAVSVYAADVDGDGDMDVLGTATSANDITWWENDGSESFTKHIIHNNFSSARSVYAVDVDGDGDMDVLGAAYNANDITWWENDGSESFTQHTIDTDFTGAYKVYATDIDGDGDMDVLGPAVNDDDITWWENDGSESFTKRTIDADFDNPRSVYAVDVDGDGDMDVLAAGLMTDEITWWEQQGTPSKTVTFTDGSSFTPSVTQGGSNQAIGRFNLNSSATFGFIAATIKLTGTRSGASDFRLWQSSDNSFSSGSDIQLGSMVEFDPGTNKTVTFNNFVSPISSSGTFYFLTCDVAANASGVIKGVVVSNSKLTFSGGALTGSSISNADLSSSDASLPVELTSFHVLSTRNDAVTLQWVTESEINNLGFILDRRVPGTEWTEIATYITHPELQGQGSVTHQTIYSYTDNTVMSAETYDYRLADVDYDGNKVYHSMTVMGVSPNDVVPETFTLYPAYPNPFNPTTNIRYDLSEQAQVTLTIYDLIGREVTQLINTTQEAGYRSVQWNATNDAGSPVSAGIYLYMIQAGEFRQAKKMVLLK